jgi:hypothetical protein
MSRVVTIVVAGSAFVRLVAWEFVGIWAGAVIISALCWWGLVRGLYWLIEEEVR